MRTGVAFLIAGVHRAGDAVVAAGGRSRHASVLRVAGLHAVAEEPVIARPMIGHMIAGIGGFVATVGGAGDAVVAIGADTGQATERCVTRLDAIAILAVVAGAVIGDMQTGIRRLVACIHRARNRVVANDCGAALAAVYGIANFHAVTEGRIGTKTVAGNMAAFIRRFIAGVHRTSDTVIAIHRNARLASQRRVTNLDSVAELSVAAKRIARRMHTRIAGGAADIDRTRNAVIALRRQARHAGAGDGVTDFLTIAEDAISAIGVGEAVYAAIAGLIAQRDRTGIGTVEAALCRVTDLGSVAEQAIAASRIVRHKSTSIIDFVTIIIRTGNAVVTGHGRARLAARCRMTRFASVAELTIIAIGVDGGVHAGILAGIAGVTRTSEPVVANGRRAGDAGAGQGITGLDSIAELSVVALFIGEALHTATIGFVAEGRWSARIGIVNATKKGIARFAAVAEGAVVAEFMVGHMNAGVTGLVTKINGARHGVHAVGRRTRQAAMRWMTGLAPVAPQTVVTGRVARNVNARIQVFIARIVCTRHTIVTNHNRTRLAAQHRVTEFDAVAVLPIVTDLAVGRVVTRIGLFIADIDGAGDAIIACDRLTGLAAESRVAGFDTVAIEAIAARTVIGQMNAGVRILIAFVRGAGHAVVARHRRPCLAPQGRMARFGPIAVEAVVANGGIGRVDTGISRFVARIHGTRHAIVAIRCRTRLTPADRIANLRSVAPGSIVTGTMAGQVNTGINIFIAGILRTSDPVITVGRRASLATQRRMADFRTIAILTVAACSVAWNVIACVGHFVAGVNRTGDTVVTGHRRTRLATQERIANFSPVAILTIAAQRIARRVQA